MLDFFEILVCTLAVFGGYTVLNMIKIRLSYPRAVRSRLRGAIIAKSDEEICKVVKYARYLQREQKISSERLIILLEDDIIEDRICLANLGDAYHLDTANTNDFEEACDDT